MSPLRYRLIKPLLNPVISFFIAVGLVFLFTAFVLLLTGVNPTEAFRLLATGSLSSFTKLGQVFQTWIPLMLCSLGLLYTFRVNIWNIGVEGQMVMGAVFSMSVFHYTQDTSSGLFFFVLSLAGGFFGGALWAYFAALLKNHGGVNEIFAGLGMNFVSQGAILWLIFGPWKRPGIASMSGTETISPAYFLSTLSEIPVPVSALISVLGIIVFSYILLNHTTIGLGMKAVGSNPRATVLFGLDNRRLMVLAMLAGGGLAGCAGFFQITGVYHRLIPPISSGYGYLALLVVMLANYDIRYVPFIAFFFSCLNVGSIQLPMELQLDSALSGVIQGASVLMALVVISVRHKLSLYLESES